MKRLWVALLPGFAAGVALAQAPPCPCPVPTGPPPLWSGSAEISYLATSGNTSTSSLGGAIEVDYKPAPWTLTFKTSYLRSESEHVLTAEQATAALKGARDLTPHIDVFVGGDYLRNRFSGLNSLVTGGGGAGYKILLGPVHTLRVEAGVGYAHESQTNGDDRSYANGRAGLTYKWQISKVAAFTNDATFLYDFSDSSNWYFNEKAAITADLTNIFALKASYTLLYRNEPVPTFRKTDTATAAALVAKF
jgi:putative salt-induced outer membrane protein